MDEILKTSKMTKIRVRNTDMVCTEQLLHTQCKIDIAMGNTTWVRTSLTKCFQKEQAHTWDW